MKFYGFYEIFNFLGLAEPKKKKHKKNKKKKPKDLGEWEWANEIITTLDVKTNNVQKEEGFCLETIILLKFVRK